MHSGQGLRLLVAALGTAGVALLATSTGLTAGQGQMRSVTSAGCGSAGMRALSLTSSSSTATKDQRRKRPVGRIVATISTYDPNAEENSDPYGVAFGEGSVWVADRGVDAVLRVNPARNRVATRIAVPGSPARLAVGDGSVWVTQESADSVARIDIASGAVVATIPLGGIATGEPALGAGSVWALDGTHRQVVRIDPATNSEVARIDIGGSGPVGGVLFAYGSVWASSDTDAQVVRIDPATNAVASRVPLRRDSRRGRIPMDPQALGRGAVWVANTDVNSRGYRTLTTVNAASTTADPKRIAIARRDLVGLARLGRSMWATDSAGTLWRVDMVSRRVLGSVGICAKTAYVAAGAGSVWAVDPAGAMLVRVRPAAR